jgi:hypothetical protein
MAIGAMDRTIIHHLRRLKKELGRLYDENVDLRRASARDPHAPRVPDEPREDA